MLSHGNYIFKKKKTKKKHLESSDQQLIRDKTKQICMAKYWKEIKKLFLEMVYHISVRSETKLWDKADSVHVTCKQEHNDVSFVPIL